MRVVIDTCVVLDRLMQRENFAEDAAKIFDLVATKKIKGCLVAISVLDSYHLVKGATHDNEKSRDEALKLCQMFSILKISKKNCKNATASPISDYEDAVIEEVTVAHRIKYIVTRNKKHYKRSRAKILEPQEFLQLFARDHHNV